MISRKPVLFSFVFVSGVLVAVAAVEAQLCEPAPDGFSCVPLACSPVPEDQCIGTVLRVDWATGAITMVECQCRDFNACHVEFGNVTPFPVGKCPAGHACEVHAWDAATGGQQWQGQAKNGRGVSSGATGSHARRFGQRRRAARGQSAYYPREG